jgi:LysM repeat protein
MKTSKSRILIGALVLALVASIVPMGAAPMASSGDVLFNGGFENGFVANPACPGVVGAGWGCFNNGGTAAYGFYDDMWARTVAAGSHSQLIEINTKQVGGDNNRTAGIYQTARVVPGAVYELSLKGMIRADERNTDDPWRYRVYVGFDYTGGANWQAVTDWRELPWDTYSSRTDPGGFSSYSTQVTPSGHALTVFVRGERRWGTWYEETDFNLDSISLFGVSHAAPQPLPEPIHPVDGGKAYFPPPAQPGDAGAGMQPVQPIPPVDSQHGDAYFPPPAQPGDDGASAPAVAPAALTCDGPNLVVNGGFENGFAANGVALSWTGFTSGGPANYGFYDEMWPPVVSQGKHGQLIEINTKHLPDGTAPDRFAGIAQPLVLHPGATYEISFDAQMREEPVAGDEDAYRYLVEWGYSTSGATDPSKMSYRQMVPLTTIYPRTAPGALQAYRQRFTAPGGHTTLAIWGLKKWATLNRELDVNLDNVSLRLCRMGAVPPIQPPHKPPYKPVDGCTWYVVKPGDTLGKIAAQFHTTVQAIAARNHIANPNFIYVGQKLCIPTQVVIRPLPVPYTAQAATPSDGSYYAPPAQPGDGSEARPAETASTEAAAQAATAAYHVQRGDTLSGIAAEHGSTVTELMRLNDIENPNAIFVGQEIRLP